MSNPHMCFSFALVVMGAATCLYPMWKTVAPLYMSSFLSGLCFNLIAAGKVLLLVISGVGKMHTVQQVD